MIQTQNDFLFQKSVKTSNFEDPLSRCLQSGASCLSLRECLSLLVGSPYQNPAQIDDPQNTNLDLATQVLNRPGAWSDPAEEARAFFISMEAPGTKFLDEIDALDPCQRTRLLVAFEIARRYSEYRCKKRKKGKVPIVIGELTIRCLGRIPERRRLASQEWLGFVPVHRGGQLGRLCEVENGVRTHVNTDPAELFARLLALRPFGFYLVHNHPSGLVEPSRKDMDLTERVGSLGKQLGVQLFGHWIVAPQGEFLIETQKFGSFRDYGNPSRNIESELEH